MIIFKLNLTTCKSCSIFGGSWGGSKNQTTIKKFSLPKSVKRSVVSNDLMIFATVANCRNRPSSKIVHQNCQIVVSMKVTLYILSSNWTSTIFAADRGRLHLHVCEKLLLTKIPKA